MSLSDNSHDFSLSSICWGYRDIFKQTIQRLFDEGYLGPEREVIVGSNTEMPAEELRKMARKSLFKLDSGLIVALSFLPDFFYRVDGNQNQMSKLHSDSPIADLEDEAGIGDALPEDPVDSPIGVENHDLLVQYLVESERDPSPKIDFYERPLIIKRGLSWLIFS